MTNWIHLTETGDQPVWLNAGHIASVAASTDEVAGAETTISLAGGAVFDIVETTTEVMRRISEAASNPIGPEIEHAADIPEGIGASSGGQQTLLIYGMSDDLVEVKGYLHERFNLGAGSEVTLLIAGPGDDPAYLNVRARFTTSWELSVLHSRGGQWPYPIHAVRCPDRPEAPALLLEVPPGTTVTHLERI